MLKRSLLALLIALLPPVAAAKADQLPADLAFGFKTYFAYHGPRNKDVKYNLYPFAGPIIPYGHDIPVCDAARTEAAYAKKRDLRYILHGKDGWLFRTVDFRTDFAAAPATLDYFKRLSGLLASKGQTLVVAFQPPRALVSARHIDPADMPKDYSAAKAEDGYKAFLKQLNGAGVKAVDLSEGADKVPYFTKGDFHWAPEGADDAARKLAEALKDAPGYGGIAKEDFVSEVSGPAGATRGALEEFIQETCKMNVELTTKPVWTTVAKDKKADAASLLGDAAFPAVTVVGTSNSAEDEKFNFVGALKHYARVDIYNAALTAGGFGASSYRYYASEEYHQHPPKIIVWEFLPQHNYNSVESQDAFRQMIPAVYGSCSDKASIAHYSGAITDGQTAFFTRIRDLSLKDSYLDLEVTAPAERNLRLDILYANGDADQVDLTRSTRAENNGKYYLELGRGADTKAIFFHLATDRPQGKIAARICPYPQQIAEK